MRDFIHVVLTQFNLKGYDTVHSGLDLNWLTSRFKLFETFCYPSMRGQSNQNFKWIVYFDSSTPQAFKDKIDEYALWENFVPVYLSDPLTAEVNKQSILLHIPKDCAYLISTLLDNDDGLCRDFIQQIQINFENQEFEFISFVNGHVLHTDGKLYTFKYLNNPFVSLIEKIKEPNSACFTTVLCAPHTQLSRIGPMRSVKMDFSWLQVVHSRNLSNKIRGIRVPKNNINQYFMIDLESMLKNESPILFAMDYVYSFTKTIARDVALLVLRRY
jgi:Putative rhamnosyl transferase